jgi:plasmid stabilization system protein ParE
VWTHDYSKEAKRDIDLIFAHLSNSYIELGDSVDDAMEHAGARIQKLRTEIGKLANTPYIGTLRPDIGPNLRFLRRDKAAIWFVQEEERRNIFIVGIFYGAQDHVRHMLARMLAH